MLKKISTTTFALGLLFCGHANAGVFTTGTCSVIEQIVNESGDIIISEDSPTMKFKLSKVKIEDSSQEYYSASDTLHLVSGYDLVTHVTYRHVGKDSTDIGGDHFDVSARMQRKVGDKVEVLAIAENHDFPKQEKLIDDKWMAFTSLKFANPKIREIFLNTGGKYDISELELLNQLFEALKKNDSYKNQFWNVTVDCFARQK